MISVYLLLDYSSPCFRGESLHSLSLIRSSPRYVTGTPKGVLSNEWPSHMTGLLNFRTSELLKSPVFSNHRTPLGVPVS